MDDLEDASNELMLVDEEEVCLARQCITTAILLRPSLVESAPSSAGEVRDWSVLLSH